MKDSNGKEPGEWDCSICGSRYELMRDRCDVCKSGERTARKTRFKYHYVCGHSSISTEDKKESYCPECEKKHVKNSIDKSKRPDKLADISNDEFSTLLRIFKNPNSRHIIRELAKGGESKYRVEIADWFKDVAEEEIRRLTTQLEQEEVLTRVENHKPDEANEYERTHDHKTSMVKYRLNREKLFKVLDFLTTGLNSLTNDGDTVNSEIIQQLIQLKKDTNIPCVLIETGKSAGRIYEIKKKIMKINRGANADILLEDKFVHRMQHAELYEDNDNYFIRDVSGKNGVRIENKIITNTSEKLRDGMEFTVGTTVLLFKFASQQ